MDSVVEAQELRLEIDYAATVNFAWQQNALPVIRELRLATCGPKPIFDIEVQISSKPSWAEPLTEVIDQLVPDTEQRLNDPPLRLSLNYLAELSERLRGELEIVVSGKVGSRSAEVTELQRESFPVEVFAFDEWAGVQTLPELLAAFVTPNLASLEGLLGRAADLLGERTGRPALDGYQSKNRERVYAICASIWQALREQSIRYSNPPASFETTGQRIRFADQILRSRLATCLDTVLLFAGLLEQAGLRPLILLHQGHAYAGCWLAEDGFATPTLDDLQAIRKRCELDEMVVFETTLVCEGKQAAFEAAETSARAHLHKDTIFLYAIDVHRARAGRAGIRPLPLQRESAAVDFKEAQALTVTPASCAEDAPASRRLAAEIDLDTETVGPGGRLEVWKQKLLDLSLRNRLLNFKDTKGTVPFVCPDPGALEDSLVDGEQFRLLGPIPAMAGQDPRSLATRARQLAEDPMTAELRQELAGRRLHSTLPEEDLDLRLLNLYRTVRAELEESGANTLYLTLGMLEWKATPTASVSHRAPLLLVPVRLVRAAAGQRPRLSRLDEETMLNVTLLEMLRRDFELVIPGLDPLPGDESGVDVPTVFQIFRTAIKDFSGWELHLDVSLGQFSFAKFLLWKDLQDRVDDLKQHRVIAHLLDHPGEPFPDDIPDTSPAELDATVRPQALFCPAPADSSQLAAVIAAANGKDFVLRGPPGTGKSQTITNLIAHNLAMGRRVLFVAEKQAALNVVHDRLTKLGLGPFCLELHSNRAGKAEVLRQFGEALDYGDERLPAEWERTCAELEQQRDALNAVVETLHRPLPNGISAYHCFAFLATKNHSEEPPLLDIPHPETQTANDLAELRECCSDLVIRGAVDRLPPDVRKTLRPFRVTDWNPDWEDTAVTLAHQLAEASADAENAFDALMKAFGLAISPATSTEVDQIRELANVLLGAETLPPAFIETPGWTEFRQSAETVVEVGKKAQEAEAPLERFDVSKLSEADTLQGTLEGIQKFRRDWNPFKGLFWKKQESEIQPFLTTGDDGRWDPEALENALAFAIHWQSLHADAVEKAADLKERLGKAWSVDSQDWDALLRLLKLGDTLHDLAAALGATDLARLAEIRERIGLLLESATDLLGPTQPVGQRIVAFDQAWDHLQRVWRNFAETLVADPESLPAGETYFAGTADLAQRVKEGKDYLDAWCYWQEAWQRAEDSGLGPLLATVEAGDLSLKALPSAAEHAYRATLLRRLISDNETLRTFWGDEHEARIRRFRELDDQHMQLSGKVIAARLAAKLPRGRQEDSPRNSEIGILQRERAKRARHKPVRKLLAETADIVPLLKPCFLMSPLSVAQYFDAGAAAFDVVVFDEASQIPVWDAIGAIARGTQLIVVGDPKQLPPTNFFNRSNSEDAIADDTDIEDLESILDECLGSGLSVYHLDWHYRSRHESLIAFSNYHYYDNRLLTFPSPEHGAPGVRLVSVDGYYDKGKSRTNPAEAKTIVAEVVRRLQDPVLSQKSIGVVTFSQTQQTLVQDLIEKAQQDHPEIQSFFDSSNPEPVFVKNLENVQGDERDVILFSICYGPDQHGKLSMNFGPLNRSGGERRLNVAVTRAKCEVVIFSTLKPDQIDLSRTRAIGAAHLKAYLTYAERGASALAAAVSQPSHDDFASPFEQEVANFLRAHGYTVHSQVGCSGYKIDLAVVSPEAPGRYVIGIECDGATYHRAATARDRDKLRQGVLEGLGWRMHRIWSTDWWRKRKNAEKRLLSAVEKAIAAEVAKPETRGSSITDASAESASEAKETLHPPAVDGFSPEAALEPPNKAATESEVESASISFASSAAESPAAEIPGRERVYELAAIAPPPADADFYAQTSRPLVRRQMMDLITAEGPILEERLRKRIVALWGFNRSGSKINEVLAECLPTELAKTSQNGSNVCWPAELDPATYPHFRRPGSAEATKRLADEIPFEEIQNAARHVHERFGNLPDEDLHREILKCFGLNRLTTGTASLLNEALKGGS